ncbi:hypothetical protein BU25DRAFT_440684 [Macroventuria anomochaeta]|uniref:Uncharacterized protein n=1 Tax=Macroventuria anomochaeta TaxID=301207 RepID=A0ACB6RWD2_9PLEO|nr:uncharacterized protein BU25DRAFT_440684 [Macroventuria anomochaeta]KAF2626280.1 hypothetical protein BU25DRAFT_440684 [Macroventuria anomochaeta]
MSNFRALQPAPMDQEPTPQPQSRPILTSKPKRTVTLGACVACRKRKSKCDGNRPVCTCCAQKDTQCVYELGPNEKPSQAMKRKNEEMQGELSNLRQLYDFLRLRPAHEAMEILKRIRANSPDVPPSQHIQELADFVRQGDLLIQQPLHTPPLSNPDRDPTHPVTLPSLRQALDSPGALEPCNLLYPSMYPMGLDGPATQRRRHTHGLSARTDSQSSLPRPTSIEAILQTPSTAAADDLAADPRLGFVSNWTRVTDDTGFLAHLFTIWTEREYVYYHFLDREAFLADLSCGRSDFCSELLVNIVLASACFHSSAVKDRNKPFSENSIQTSFYYEARRLWDLEEGRDCLTKVQAGMILYLVLAKYGRDRDGQKFLLEACITAQNLGLFDHESPHHSTTPSHISVDRWRRARAVTAWAVHNFQLSMSITYSFPVVIKNLPAVPIPYHDVEPLFRSECALHIILLDCVSIIQDNEYTNPRDTRSADRIEACYSRLRSWWYSRPTSLDADKYPSQVHLLCAMQYNVNVVKLFRPVLDREAYSEQAAPYIDRARTAISASLREIRRLVSLHDTHHGWSNAITFVIHGITVASFGTLDEMSHNNPILPQPENDERYQGLFTCLRALTVLLSYSYYAQPIFRLLTQKCAALGVRLPAEVQGALDYCTSEGWTKKAAELVSSQYIADTRSVAKDTESARMDAVISRWESLSLEDKKAWAARKGKDRAGV